MFGGCCLILSIWQDANNFTYLAAGGFLLCAENVHFLSNARISFLIICCVRFRERKLRILSRQWQCHKPRSLIWVPTSCSSLQFYSSRSLFSTCHPSCVTCERYCGLENSFHIHVVKCILSLYRFIHYMHAFLLMMLFLVTLWCSLPACVYTGDITT